MPRKPEPPTAKTTVTRKRTGEERRKLTIYLPPDLYRALGHFAVDHDLDMSGAAVEAIRHMVGG